MSDRLQNVDHMALKTNQATIIVLGILSYIINIPWLTIFVAIIMALGTIIKKPGFLFIYRVFKNLGWLKPEILQDNPEPHRFAQGFGAVVLGAGSVLLFSGFTVTGWGLTWLVISLAALNLFTGFCVGCAMYYWLTRMNVPGFDKTAPSGVFPGIKPKQ